MNGSWDQQKLDTLRYVVNYDYFTPLYDGNIPTSVLVEGFHADNHSREPAVPVNVAPNLGLNRQRPQLLQGGYYVQSPQRIAMELAPLIPNFKQPCAGNWKTLVNREPIGVDSADGNFRGRLTHFKPSPDPGFPLGVLVHPEIGARGKVLQAQLPRNFGQSAFH